METKEDNRPKNIWQSKERMTKLLAHLGIAKTKEMKVTSNASDKGFNFRGIDDIRNTIAPLQEECALDISSTTVARNESERKTISTFNNKVTEKTSLWVNLEVKFILTNTLDGSLVERVYFGEGNDFSDKATSKAYSQAYKSMAINEFNIPTVGEQEDEIKALELVTERSASIFNSAEERDVYIANCTDAFARTTTEKELKDIMEFYRDKLVLMANSHDEEDRKARNKASEAYLNHSANLRDKNKGAKL